MDDVIDLTNDEDETVFEMDKILDVRLSNRTIQYQITWLDWDEPTWEPETSFLAGESFAMLLDFKEKNKEKIDSLLEKLESRKNRKKKQEEEVEESDSVDLPAEEDSFLAPRELTEEDNFYGKPVKELQGESKRLFDPTHKQSATDLLLANMGGTGRVSRSKAAEMKKAVTDSGSGGESRSHTPSKLETPTKPPPKRRGRQKVEKVAPEPKKKRVGRKAKVVVEIEEEEAREEEEEEHEEKNEPSTSTETTRKRVIDEDDFERRSETPPEPEKPKFFSDRDDDDESEELWDLKLKMNNTDPQENIRKLVKNMIPKQGNLIDAILKEDLVSARIIFKQMRIDDVREVINRYRDQSGRPLLHTLIHSTKATSDGFLSSLAAMRFVLSISRQFIFCISDENENIAMHEAVRLKNLNAVRLFAHCGSLLMKKNKLGQTPFDIAIMNKDSSIIKFLLNRGVTFHELLPKLPETTVKEIVHTTPDIMNLIQETHSALKTELQRMRRRLYNRKLQDIRAVTDVLIAPRHDNNDIEFNFDYNGGKLDNSSQGHLLMVLPIAYSEIRLRWICSSSTTRLCGPPILNNVQLKHAQNRTNPTVFYAVPKVGMNNLTLRLSNNNWNSEMAITAQLVRYEVAKSAPAPASSSAPPRPVPSAPPSGPTANKVHRPNSFHKKF